MDPDKSAPSPHLGTSLGTKTKRTFRDDLLLPPAVYWKRSYMRIGSKPSKLRVAGSSPAGPTRKTKGLLDFTKNRLGYQLATNWKRFSRVFVTE